MSCRSPMHFLHVSNVKFSRITLHVATSTDRPSPDFVRRRNLPLEGFTRCRNFESFVRGGGGSRTFVDWRLFPSTPTTHLQVEYSGASRSFGRHAPLGGPLCILPAFSTFNTRLKRAFHLHSTDDHFFLRGDSTAQHYSILLGESNTRVCRFTRSFWALGR